MTQQTSYGLDSTEIQADTEDVGDAKKACRGQFKEFKEENKPFNFHVSVTDEDGFTASILLDFSIEDYETGAYYVGYVSSYKQEQPTDDGEEIRMSSAFCDAMQILEAGARVVDDRGHYGMRPEFLTSDTPNGDLVEASYTIVYNEDNLE
jgi:hypothetical protein